MHVHVISTWTWVLVLNVTPTDYKNPYYTSLQGFIRIISLWNERIQSLFSIPKTKCVSSQIEDVWQSGSKHKRSHSCCNYVGIVAVQAILEYP